MEKIHRPLAPALSSEKELKTLVENRSVYSLDHCELNIFETRQQSEHVHLQFDSLVFTAMFRGKKVMHLNGLQPFDYLPGESVIVPERETMVIDFPEADDEHPTQCLALAIDKEKIRHTLDVLNQHYTRVEAGDCWKIDERYLHLHNSQEMTTTINRLVTLTREDNKAKDIFADFMLQELLIRLMQTQARNLILRHYKSLSSSHRFAYVIQYIRENLHQPITVEQLAKQACMSKPHFFRSFKMEFGISPVEFIQQERLALAKQYLLDPRLSVSEVAYKAGFNDVPYFTQLFKKWEGTTPGAYRQKIIL
jgi:AraC-like DNA-binding protein